MQTELKIKGMSCEHCVHAVSEALSELPGVHHVEVVLDAGLARVDYDEKKLDFQQFSVAIEEAGYELV